MTGREFLQIDIISRLSHSFIPQPTFTDCLKCSLLGSILGARHIKVQKVNGASKSSWRGWGLGLWLAQPEGGSRGNLCWGGLTESLAKVPAKPPAARLSSSP